MTGFARLAALKIHVQLQIQIVGILGANRGKTAFDIVTDEEVAVTSLQLGKLRHRPAAYHIDFRSDKLAVGRIDAVTVSRRRRHSAAWSAAHVVEIVRG